MRFGNSKRGNCLLCNGYQTQDSLNLFNVCSICHLATAVNIPNSGVVRNQINLKMTRRPSILNLEKLRVVRKAKQLSESVRLIDFGCGDGEFLDCCRSRKLSVQIEGVEAEESSRRAAAIREIRVFTCVDEISQQEGSLATMWHSLEHIPPHGISQVISQLMSKGTSSIVISVPNGNSKLWRKYGTAFAYYDEASHFVQFSIETLEYLAKEHNLKIRRHYWILSYELFAVLQTVLNLHYPRNMAYTALKRGESTVNFTTLISMAMYLMIQLPRVMLLLFYSFSRRWRAVTTVLLSD